MNEPYISWKQEQRAEQIYETFALVVTVLGLAAFVALGVWLI
jgi:hypothetical protein